MSIIKNAVLLLSRFERCLDANFFTFAAVLVCTNLLFSFAIIAKVPYTEIDWVAYMEEVSGVLNENEFDYLMLRGGTGPLVYPAGFVYVFSMFYYLTDRGRDIRTAQYIFAALQAVVLSLVLFIYRKCYKDHNNPRSFPIWIVGLLLLSRRVMSLFVLRLFNEGVQILLMYAAIALFTENKWSLGCLLFSLSVSVKMNALLFAPGVAVLLCQARGTGGAIRRILGICLSTQLILGAPFLLHAPQSYVARAFELTREFLYKWSVNGAFLAEDMFLNKKLAAVLLILHLGVLLSFGQVKWTSKREGGLLGLVHIPVGGLGTWLGKMLTETKVKDLKAGHITWVLFSCNFIGIMFARTLHYQFYLWYAHTLPFLVCYGKIWWTMRLAVLVVIEVVFNVYPPHPLAATSLHIAHLILLISLWAPAAATNSNIYKEDEKSDKNTS